MHIHQLSGAQRMALAIDDNMHQHSKKKGRTNVKKFSLQFIIQIGDIRFDQKTINDLIYIKNSSKT
jgi:hypothetical protein